jgi:alpha-L-fucosidase
MQKAAQAMSRANDINGKSGAYRPTWESLDQHKTPEWYLDAKFGMFVDWGLYSIPAYAPRGYPDWYLHRMHTDTKAYHEQFWGADFREDDFIPLFTAEDFDAEHLAEVARDAGMRYVVPFLKHHDGFCLWNSSYTLRNSVKMGPRRDIADEWLKACRKRNLRYGFYYSIDDWIYPVIAADDGLRIREWHATDGCDFRLGPFSEQQWERRQLSGKIPVRDFFNQYINPAGMEFIEKYDPDLLWLDADWIFDADARNTRCLVAYFYNHAMGRKEVAVNDGYGCSRMIPTRGQGPDHTVHGDFNRSEGLYQPGLDKGYVNPWEECHGLSHSFGYHWEETSEDVRSAKELLDMLIEIVAGGGNLLLITNLTNTGKLDPLLAERLKVVGAWLKVNHEAIYATRKWQHFVENGVRFTRSKDGRFVYAIATQWPEQTFSSSVVKPRPGSPALLLGYDKSLEWNLKDGQLDVMLPAQLQAAKNRPCEHAWVFKFEVDQSH